MSSRSDDLLAGSVDETSDAAELRRIDFTGTMWFGAAVIAIAVTVGSVTASGWKPDAQVPGIEALWWVGSLAVVLAVAAFGWAGCPVLGFPLHVADRQKRLCMRAGVVLFFGGGLFTSLALLLS